MTRCEKKESSGMMKTARRCGGGGAREEATVQTTRAMGVVQRIPQVEKTNDSREDTPLGAFADY